MATLINGNGNLAIYAQQDADWYAALMGGQTVITAVGNQFAYELLASNTIGVKDGVIITKEGRRIQLDANAIDSFDIPTGAQGTTNYYIIGYHLVTGNQSEQTCETFVQLMENGTDTIPEGSFRDGDDEVFVSLYRVEQDDLTIGTITLLLPQLSGSFQSQITELNNDLSDKVSGFTEDTYSAVTGLAYDSTNKKLGLKVGADTVIPFSGEIKATLITTRSTGWGSTDSSGYTAIPSKYKALIVQFAGTNFSTVQYVYFRNGDKNEIGAISLNNSYGRDFTFSNNKLTHGVCGNAQSYAGDIYESKVYGIETALL